MTVFKADMLSISTSPGGRSEAIRGPFIHVGLSFLFPFYLNVSLMARFLYFSEAIMPRECGGTSRDPDASVDPGRKL